MGIALVFSGGSTKVPLHIGAIKAIEESGIKPTSFYGTSAGAIIAACLAYGMRYEELYKLAIKLDFNELLEGNFINLLSSISFVNGDKFYDFYDNIFDDLTFNSMPYPCHIVGHCLNTYSYEVFNKVNSPNMMIKDALRISSSVPMLIKPVEYNKKLYVDGGMSKNFPVDLVPDDTFFIGHLINSPLNNNMSNIISFGLHLIDQLIQSNATTSIKNSHKRNIIIQSEYPLQTTEFSVPLEDKLRMMEIGYINMKKGLINDN